MGKKMKGMIRESGVRRMEVRVDGGEGVRRGNVDEEGDRSERDDVGF